MKIELEFVKFKNFLSFGSKWQEVELKHGVNLVLGYDEDNDKSNGSGKTSFLETIPFALFGKVHKNIKKDQIVNWKNRKGCEVHLTFKKGESEYRVFRGIKPDKFEIYKDKELIDKPAHVKDYQLVLDSIIGLNYNIFMSLVHSNINSSAPILAMKKPDKRKFIEKTFGLELYTKLHDVCNEKLKKGNEKIKEMDFSILKNKEAETLAEQRVIFMSGKLKEMGSSEIELKDAEEKLKELVDGDENWDDQLDAASTELKIIEEADVHHAWLVRAFDNKIVLANQKVRMMDKQVKSLKSDIDRTEDIETKKRKMEGILKIWGNEYAITEKMNLTKELIKGYNEKIDKSMDRKQTLMIDVTSCENNVKRLQKEFGVFKIEGKCPRCSTDVEGSDILSKLEGEIKEDQDFADDRNKDIKEIDKSAKELKKDLEKSCDTLKELEEMKIQYLLLEKEVTSSNYDELVSRLEILNGKITRTKSAEGKLSIKREEIDAYRDKSIKRIEILKEEKTGFIDKINNISNTQKEVDRLTEKVEFEIGSNSTYFDLIKKDEKNIKKLLAENRAFTTKIGKLKDLKDYISFIKECCGDDKVKQYAISSIMPYLNKQTNHYLSDVGYNFWVKLDKWLDAQLEGPGITKGSYGSLSGGEGRGIDLSLQFAFLDIARLKAGEFPDINIMDEILDSSIDIQGLQKIIDIIQVKQREDNSRVFIISHRQEVDELEIDNIYFVTKNDGYSSVKIKEKE